MISRLRLVIIGVAANLSVLSITVGLKAEARGVALFENRSVLNSPKETELSSLMTDRGIFFGFQRTEFVDLGWSRVFHFDCRGNDHGSKGMLQYAVIGRGAEIFDNSKPNPNLLNYCRCSPVIAKEVVDSAWKQVRVLAFGVHDGDYEQIWSILCNRDLERFVGDLRGGYGGVSGAAGVDKVPNQKNRTYERYRELPSGPGNSLFSRLRHAPLFAEIGFIMTLCATAFWAIPVGFDHLFPLKVERPNDSYKKRCLGGLLSLLGWGAAGVLLSLSFLA